MLRALAHHLWSVLFTSTAARPCPSQLVLAWPPQARAGGLTRPPRATTAGAIVAPTVPAAFQRAFARGVSLDPSLPMPGAAQRARGET